VARVFNKVVEEPHRRDRLTEVQVPRLTEALGRADTATLPEPMGSEATNVRRIEVAIGDFRTTLNLDPIVTPAERHGHPEGTAEARVLEIIEIVEELDRDR
jgi:hypothetical protein